MFSGQFAILVVATSWLNGCVTAGFEADGVVACPPVVECSQEFQAQSVAELVLLTKNSGGAEMMGDFVVLRELGRANSEA